jgi:ankyrin repeat protein
VKARSIGESGGPGSGPRRRLARLAAGLVFVLLAGAGAASESLAAALRIEHVEVPGGGRLRVELRELGLDSRGLPILSASYFYEDPESGREETVGVVTLSDAPPPPLFARTKEQIDVAIGARIFSRGPRFGEWSSFDARPKAGLSIAAPEPESRTDSTVQIDTGCRVRTITHPDRMRVSCRVGNESFEADYERSGFGGLWRLDESAVAGVAAGSGVGFDELAPSGPLPELPLHAAIRGRDPIAFAQALEVVRDLDRQDDEGETPLHLAVDADAIGMALALVWLGADPQAPDATGEPPAALSPRTGHEGRAKGLARLHLQQWAERLAAAARAEKPPQPRAQADLVVGVYAAQEALVRRAVVRGADPSWPLPPDAQTLLHTPLRPETARWLVELGADLDRGDRHGRTPLMRAISDRDLGLARVLLEAGARTDVEDASGRTVLESAAQRTQNAKTSTVDLLLRSGAVVTPAVLTAAAFSQNPKTMRLLLRRPIEIEPLSPEGEAFYATVIAHGGDQINALLRKNDVWGPAFSQWDATSQQERDRELRVLALFLAAHGLVFWLSTILIALLVAGCVVVWNPAPRLGSLAIVALSMAASGLAYDTAWMRLLLSEFRLLGERLPGLPLFYLFLVLAASMLPGAAAAYGALRARRVRRVWEQPLGGAARFVSLLLLPALFVLLVLHNAGRIDAISRVHAGAVSVAKVLLRPFISGAG